MNEFENTIKITKISFRKSYMLNQKYTHTCTPNSQGFLTCSTTLTSQSVTFKHTAVHFMKIVHMVQNQRELKT